MYTGKCAGGPFDGKNYTSAEQVLTLVEPIASLDAFYIDNANPKDTTAVEEKRHHYTIEHISLHNGGDWVTKYYYWQYEHLTKAEAFAFLTGCTGVRERIC